MRHLVLSLGRRVTIHEWHKKDEKLRMIAFVDGHVWASSVAVSREYIAIGDAGGRGVSLFRWREEDHQLLSLATDRPAAPGIAVTAVSLLVDGKSLTVSVTDAGGGVSLYEYAPREAGTVLALRGDFQLSSTLAAAATGRVRVAGPPAAPLSARTRHLSFFGTSDGAIAVFVPVAERDYKRLATLATALTYCVPHVAGANPKIGREWTAPAAASAATAARASAAGATSKAAPLDGPLLARFVATLSAPTQAALAQAAGTTLDRALGSLRAIDLEAGFC